MYSAVLSPSLMVFFLFICVCVYFYYTYLFVIVCMHLCHFLYTSENWRLGSYSKSWRSRWLESCSVPVEGGRDKQHQPSHPRWIDVAKKPKTSNRRERLGCCVKVVTIKLTLLQVNITKNVKTNNKVSNYFSK